MRENSDNQVHHKPIRFALSTPEAAKSLGISENTLERHRKAGTGPKRTQISPGRFVYRPRDLKDWIDAQAARGAA
jgi:predicted DNA-binding transcriptional regulator AlpA